MGYALLVGNGINRVTTNGPSWGDIIGEIADETNQPGMKELFDSKPFTFTFDELVFLAQKDGGERIEIESLIAEKIKKIRPNKFHERLMNLGTRQILTINYDYALELAVTPDHYPSSPKQLDKYNIFRRRTAKDKYVWHLHGEADIPRSIILGYDNYTGTVQKMREYIKAKGGYHGLRSPFREEIYDFDIRGNKYSWIDVFLRDDLHIMGVGLDYIEIDLWWLIYYKADLERRRKNVGKTFYYHFKTGKKSSTDLGKISSLEAYGVNIIYVDAQESYDHAWDLLLSEIEKLV